MAAAVANAVKTAVAETTSTFKAAAKPITKRRKPARPKSIGQTPHGTELLRTQPLTSYQLLPRPWRFPKGQREVFLPDFEVGLINSRRALTASQATFRVPLWMNKLDLKDFLWNCYRVPVSRISSIIRLRRRVDEPKDPFSRKRKFVKNMTVTMEKIDLSQVPNSGVHTAGEHVFGGPFVWPEKFDRPAFDEDLSHEVELYQEKESMYESKYKKKLPVRNAETLAEQAALLRSGKVKWTPSWMALGDNPFDAIKPGVTRTPTPLMDMEKWNREMAARKAEASTPGA